MIPSAHSTSNAQFELKTDLSSDRPVESWQWSEYVLQQAPEILLDEIFIIVSVSEQKFYVCQNKDARLMVEFSGLVSTAKAGVGNLNGSGQTPLGWHEIKLKIGEACPQNSVFIGRRPTGEVYDQMLGAKSPKRDWILTRILWLSGLQRGFNRRVSGNNACDTLRRFIYFHATSDNPEEPIGQPFSHGCIRLKNKDLLAIFDKVSIKTKVLIVEPEFKQLTDKLVLKSKGTN